MLIRGNEGGMVQLSPCCSPIPGDDIVGIILQDKGLVVHRRACQNARRVEPDKKLPVAWEAQKDRMFSVLISVLAHNDRGALAAIATAISGASANIETVDTQDTHQGDGFMHIHFHLQVESVQHLEKVLAQIEQVEAVLHAERR